MQLVTGITAIHSAPKYENTQLYCMDNKYYEGTAVVAEGKY